MELAVISYPEPFDGENTVIRHLFDAGMERFHLRKYGLDEMQTRTYIEAIPAPFHKYIMLHHQHHLTAEYGLMGIHFSKHSPYIETPVDDFQRSKSCHSFNAIVALPDAIDYCFLSPIYNSISKPEHKSSFPDEGDLWEFLSDSDGPEIYALGGITAHAIHNLSSLGFYGAAVLGAVWEPAATHGKHNESVQSFKTILDQCQTVHTH
jgi:thiamine monophosphate synthase